MSNELKQACKEEYSLRINLRGAREATVCGAPLYIEDRARRAWAKAYCKVRELRRSSGYE